MHSPEHHERRAAAKCPDCAAPIPDHRATCPGLEALKSVVEDDRAWFHDHPDAEFYFRPLVGGDLGIMEDGAVVGRIKVTKLATGVRSRQIVDVALPVAEDGKLTMSQAYAVQLLGLIP